MLKTEQNTPDVDADIKAALENMPDHGPYATHFEHGQWWVTCQCGATWSVVDAEGPGIDPNIGLDFEQVNDAFDEDFHGAD